MAKIGTAHIEIKPVVDDETLDALAVRIEEAVFAALTRAFGRAEKRVNERFFVQYGDAAGHTPDEVTDILNTHMGHSLPRKEQS